MPVRRLLSIAAATTLLLGVAACDPEGKDEPPTAASSAASDGGGTTTGESTSTKPSDGGGDDGTDGGDKGATAIPDVPEPDPADFPDMDKHTDKGAEQAFRYYWAMLTWAYQTGDTKTLKTLYDSSCGNCAENMNAVLQLKSGESYWSPFSIRDEGIRNSDSSTYEVEISYKFLIPKHREPGDSPGRTKLEPDTRMDTSGGLSWINGAWIVQGVAFSSEKVEQ